MNRSKREIKTPKRFDDEAFERQKQAAKQTSPFQPLIKLPRLTPARFVPEIKLDPRPDPKPEPKPEPKPDLQPEPTSEPKLETQSESKPFIKSAQKPGPKPGPKPGLKPGPKPGLKPGPKPGLKPGPKPGPKPSPKPIQSLPLDEGLKSHNFKNSSRRRPITPPAYETLIPNVILPFWDARTAADEHEDDNVKELVHCHCGIHEELGLMVQCETCLTWQHAHCLGINQPEEAPDGYTCQACSDPKFARDSMRWAYDQDWLLKGKMKQFSCDKNSHEADAGILKKINRLIDDSLKIYRLVHNLRVKTKILQNAVNDDDAELKLFRNQWPVDYVHRDGTPFIPTVNELPTSPASAMSDPGELPVEAVADLKEPLPDIGQLDVSAILGNTDLPMVSSNDEAPSDCRTNLKLHIRQTQEFINIELAQIAEDISTLEKDSDVHHSVKFESLKNDLISMRRIYLA